MAGLLSRLKTAFFTNTSFKQPAVNTNQDIETQLPLSISPASASAGFYRSLFGRAENIDKITVPQKLIIDVVSQSMSKTDQRLKVVPRLPAIIPRLLQSLRDNNSSSKDYVNIINKDPAMAAAVLRLANSVYFNPQAKRITSIDTAVVKLGLDGLRSVVSAAVMQPVIECKSIYFSDFGHKLWQHSLCCAVACEIVAHRRGLNPYKAYLLGLFHDMGKIILFTELCQQYKINSSSASPIMPSYASFAPLMEALSPALSLSIAQDWQLPEEICSALAHQVSTQPEKISDPYARLLFQINLACEIYFSLRQASKADQPSFEVSAKKSLAEMDLPDNLFAKLDSLSVQVPKA